MNQKISVVSPYDRILTTDKTTVIMYSPRISGKSYALGQMVYIYSNKYPNHDIVVTRISLLPIANKTSLLSFVPTTHTGITRADFWIAKYSSVILKLQHIF